MGTSGLTLPAMRLDHLLILNSVHVSYLLRGLVASPLQSSLGVKGALNTHGSAQDPANKHMWSLDAVGQGAGLGTQWNRLCHSIPVWGVLRPCRQEHAFCLEALGIPGVKCSLPEFRAPHSCGPCPNQKYSQCHTGANKPSSAPPGLLFQGTFTPPAITSLVMTTSIAVLRLLTSRPVFVSKTSAPGRQG